MNGPVAPRHLLSRVGANTGSGIWELTLRYAEPGFDSTDNPLNFIGCSSGSPCSNGTGAVHIGPARTDEAPGPYGGGELPPCYSRSLRYMVNWANWTDYWYDNPYVTPLSCRRSGRNPESPSQFRKVEDPTSWELLSS